MGSATPEKTDVLLDIRIKPEVANSEADIEHNKSK